MVRLIDTLTVERVDAAMFRRRGNPGTEMARTFGGELAAQAVAAAVQCVPDGFALHSIHNYFVRRGNPEADIEFDVVTVRDSRSFALRRVVGRQEGLETIALDASFHTGARGVEHTLPCPPAPRPERLADYQPGDPGYEWFAAIDFDPCWSVRRVPDTFLGADQPRQQMWIRYGAPMPEDPTLHVCALTYAADITMLGAAMALYWGTPVQTVALDFGIRFLRPCRVDEWLLFDQVSPSAADGRAFVEGKVYDRGGRLVASVSQERMLRLADAA
ncbi:acyl-CoA thioesterase [Nocardia arthritidis]|uniref:Acyl-CoA thioesterase II n=1 Tax=Nocardia arthritidis TaxID=228602 RepID=A0A6G9YM02_9NOCA|nr:acyl-CoA thioesterase domain-containing protein [Nocardia arthritidis]QIS14097.1 acyl-CoA thioesterase II [Nocardia arthritidis]